MLRILFAAVLFTASTLAHAQASANGSEPGAAAGSESDQTNSPPASSNPPKRTGQGERKPLEAAPESPRSAPRWHSFLPGMIR